jgi:hypothetical protein
MRSSDEGCLDTFVAEETAFLLVTCCKAVCASMIDTHPSPEYLGMIPESLVENVKVERLGLARKYNV